MPNPRILHRYIFREMGKTFLLTTVALTGVLTLGGGVIDMMKLGEITAQQFLQLMLLILPVVVSLALPIAALFSATATYGRLSADNEFVACRSSGINLHVLLLPAFLLSLCSALVTFSFSNFLIPSMVREIEELVTADPKTWIESRLSQPRGIPLGKGYRLHADRHAVLPEEDLVVLDHVAFIEGDADEWDRCGTARQVVLQFTQNDAQLALSMHMHGVLFFDQQQQSMVSIEDQPVDYGLMPSLLPRKLKFLKLPELVHYWRHPDQWVKVRERMDRLRLEAGRWHVYDRLWQDWQQDNVITLADMAREERTLGGFADEGHRVAPGLRGDPVGAPSRSEAAVRTGASITIRAEKGGRVPDEGSLELADLTIEEKLPSRTRTFKATRGNLEMSVLDDLAESSLELTAYETVNADPTRPGPPTKRTFGPITVPAQWITEAQSVSDAELLLPLGLADDPLAKVRARVEHERGHTIRRAAATVNERLALSCSACVLVVFGAALAIVFRGAHVLVAFGISFVPSLVVIVSIVAGKQLAEQPATASLGIGVIWLGLVLMAGVAAWTLLFVLRR
jgi:lipopolysaccharide export LptBFGC system permease protein LptF